MVTTSHSSSASNTLAAPRNATSGQTDEIALENEEEFGEQMQEQTTGAATGAEEATTNTATVGEATTGAATTNEATTGVATTNEATTGAATTGEATT